MIKPYVRALKSQLATLRSSTSFKRVILALQLGLEFALVAFFIAYGVLHWNDIRAAFTSVSLTGLLACMLAYSAMHFFAVMATSSLLRSLGHPRPYRMLLAIHLRRLPAKYLPGGIWHAVSRGADLVNEGVPVRSIGQLVGVEQLLAIWWSGFLGFMLAGLVFDGVVRSVASMIAVCWLGVTLLALVWLGKARRWRHLVAAVSAPKILLAYIAGWFCLATGFTLYLWQSVDTLNNPLQVAASYLVSWMIGAIAFFAPQGIGVFEVSMGKALSQFGPLQGGILWFIGSYRLVVLAADLVVWGGGVWFRFVLKK